MWCAFHIKAEKRNNVVSDGVNSYTKSEEVGMSLTIALSEKESRDVDDEGADLHD